MDKNISIILIVVGCVIAIIVVSHQANNTPSNQQTFKLAPSYILLMHEIEGTESYTSKHYTSTISPSGEVVLKCFEPGGLIASSFHGTIRFDSQTLQGSWVTTHGSKNAQGGRIHLNHEDYGFSFVLFHDWSDLGHGVTKSYGSLVRH